MTVGVAIKCKDGLVIASDSLATFSRGAPVVRHSNKVHVIEHPKLLHPVCLCGAGMVAFVDKFVTRAKREAIDVASEKLGGRQLDIVDFVEHVGEAIVAILLKEYGLDRSNFFGAPIASFSLALLVVGATRAEGATAPELRAYNLHDIGVAESIGEYGTIGSGAAYAELFLHGFVPEPHAITVDEAVRLVCYAIKGVEIMDPNVGGDTQICTMKVSGDKVTYHRVPAKDLPKQAKEKMDEVLKKIGNDMRNVIKK